MKKILLNQPKSEDENYFVFSLNDKKAIEQLEWEGDDEFSLHGEMYDVIEKKLENNKLIIRCLSDTKETALIRKYQKINNEANAKTKSGLLVKLVSSSYLATTNTIILIRNIFVSEPVSFQLQIISSPVDDVITPPPQIS